MSFIYIISFGDVPRRFPIALAGYLNRLLSLQPRVSYVNLRPRERDSADELLKRFVSTELPDRLRAVGLLNIPTEEFYGTHRQELIVVNLFPLRNPDEELFLGRTLKLTLRLLGLSFYLDSCHSESCVMNGSDSLQELDRRDGMCPSCRERLLSSIGI
jgi:hypothetical protein